jgi:hypothetical protein
MTTERMICVGGPDDGSITNLPSSPDTLMVGHYEPRRRAAGVPEITVEVRPGAWYRADNPPEIMETPDGPARVMRFVGYRDA